jgi:hypothetical protein
MDKPSISDDKRRILAQVAASLDNMPDSIDEVEDLMPQMRVQVRSVLSLLRASNFRPAELMALYALIGPVLSRTPVLVPPKKKRRLVRVS